MTQREIKPFKVTEEQIEEYQFTKKQISAYEALKKAQQRCVDSGLTLLSLQTSLIAIPRKFYMNDMTTVNHYEAEKGIEVPSLTGAEVSDSGADDTEYIKDKWIK
jgi:hypothetical protein